VSEVRINEGVTVSYAAAADLVGVIDRLARLCAPQVLAGRIVDLRNDLIQCCTRAITQLDASAEVVGVRDVLALNPGALVDTTAAAEMLDITRDGVTWLCKRKRLAASKVNGRWWIEPASIELYQLSKGRSDERNGRV
jgi:hypothetical protein